MSHFCILKCLKIILNIIKLLSTEKSVINMKWNQKKMYAIKISFTYHADT